MYRLHARARMYDWIYVFGVTKRHKRHREGRATYLSAPFHRLALQSTARGSGHKRRRLRTMTDGRADDYAKLQKALRGTVPFDPPDPSAPPVIDRRVWNALR